MLGLDNVTVIRGRAEEGPVKKAVKGADIVTSRAVAPLGKLAKWSLPLVKIGGEMIALKGSSVHEELGVTPLTSNARAAEKPRSQPLRARLSSVSLA